ncbi:hypothetical protein [Pseudobacteriovorax antillogorgiicola]|uniref:Ig-like domain-containing protein n=1 Tax=Pseudobacteriovorax antillogorgiicola TaxID=1513793 RepID=A0A1Y6C1F0_9BACT|nr:hypothetical protein [Pseudobacteriovorax antillogorgiicola]TCS52431.1 hypothetical protein EDD56_109176 [Pseudobacteriovorax antillogorgiicola]SMF28728.1 hypothetical protein SAMN06296036_10937 [Pseudobacteriovorax antillogorgiicola]
MLRHVFLKLPWLCLCLSCTTVAPVSDQDQPSPDSRVQVPVQEEPPNAADEPPMHSSQPPPKIDCRVDLVPSKTDPKGQITCRVLSQATDQGPFYWRIVNQEQASAEVKLLKADAEGSIVKIQFLGDSSAQNLGGMRDLQLAVGHSEAPSTDGILLSELLDLDPRNSSELEDMRIALITSYKPELDQPHRDYKNYNRTGVDIMNSYLAELQLLAFGTLRWCQNIELFKQEATLFQNPAMGVHPDNLALINKARGDGVDLQEQAHCEANTKFEDKIIVEKLGYSEYEVEPAAILIHEVERRGRKLKSVGLRVEITNFQSHWLMCQATFQTKIQNGNETRIGPKITIPEATPIFLTPPQDKKRSHRELSSILEEFRELKDGEGFLASESKVQLTCLPCKERDKTLCFTSFERQASALQAN